MLALHATRDVRQGLCKYEPSLHGCSQTCDPYGKLQLLLPLLVREKKAWAEVLTRDEVTGNADCDNVRKFQGTGAKEVPTPRACILFCI